MEDIRVHGQRGPRALRGSACVCGQTLVKASALRAVSVIIPHVCALSCVHLLQFDGE